MCLSHLGAMLSGMRFTTKVLYGVRIMIDIAQQEGERTPLRYTAKRQEISAKYSEPIVSELRHAGLIKSRRGVHGGYLLGRPADEISLGDILRVVDDLYVASEDPQDKAIDKAFKRVRAAAWDTLDAVSLAKAAKTQR